MGEPELKCVECGSDDVDYCDMDENGNAVCEACSDVSETENLLALPDAEFAEQLRQLAAPYRRWAANEPQKLMQEADEAARRGDIDEARHRIRLCAEPKWASLDDCKKQYAEAMAEKRGVAV